MKIGLDISVLADTRKTGVAIYVYELIKAFLEINQKDEIILFGIATFDTFDYLKSIEFRNNPNVKLVIKTLPARLFRRSFLLWQKLEWPPLENFIGDKDIYHSFNWYFPPQRRGKRIATVFDMTPILFPQFHHKRTVELENIRLERIKKRANLVITISEKSKEDFLNYSPNSSVEVIYPAAPGQFNNKINDWEISKVLRKYGLKKNYFLSVSTLEPRKNLEGLIKAYNQGNFKNPLVMVGVEGWKNSEISKLIKSHQLIRSLGYIPDKDLPHIYKGARCLVYPSFYEGFGLPILEALSCGTPVICSNTSSMPEVGGEAVVYVNPNNLSEIARAMHALGDIKNLNRKLIDKGIKQARKFSWKESALKLNNLYQNS